MLDNKNKLFDLILSFGFIKEENDMVIIFKNGSELFVYPSNIELQTYHYVATRKQLIANGWINEKEFNLLFETYGE